MLSTTAALGLLLTRPAYLVFPTSLFLTTTTAPLSSLRRWAVLVVVGLGLLIVALDVTILYTALPTLERELHASTTQGLWIINAYPLVTAGLLLGAGTLGDRVGHRSLYLLGLLVFAAASFMAAQSLTAEWLILARVLQAVGAAAMMPATLALLRLVFLDERERNVAISVWASLSLLGAVLGPLLGGWLLEHYAWGSIFLINLPVALLAIIGALWLAPPQRPTAVLQPWDWRSSLLALVALSSFVAAIKEMLASQISLWLMILLFLASLSAAILFVRRQTTLSYPLLDFSLFRNAAFSSGVLAATFVTFATGALLLSIAQRFQWVAAYTPLQAGLLVSVVFVGTLPSGLIGGALLHKVGLRSLLSGGLAVASVGLLLAAFSLDFDITVLVLALLIAGLGLGATISVASTAIIVNAPTHRAGMAASVEEVAYEFGSLFAVAILGSLLTVLYSSSLQLPFDAPEAARHGMAEALMLASQAGASGGALFAAAARAFDYAFKMVMLTAAALLFGGALLTAYLLRPSRHIITGSVVVSA